MNDKTKTAPFFCHDPEVILATGLSRPVGIAMDTRTMEVFYTEDDQQSGDTYHPLTAVTVGGAKRVVLPKLLDPQGIDKDMDAKKLYYTEHHGQRVGVVNYDGSNQKVLKSFVGMKCGDGPCYPSDVKVDPVNKKVFVLVEGELATGGMLVAMDLDGGDYQVLQQNIVRAYGLTLDIANQKIFFISGGHGGFIGSMAYDGKQMAKVLDNLNWPYMLDYDPKQKRLVFSTTGVGDGLIQTATPDGKTVTKTVELGFAPMGVTFSKLPLN